MARNARSKGTVLDRNLVRERIRRLGRDAGFEHLFELLEHIDEGHDDVVFFADEAGTWQLGIPWPTVRPVWIAAFATRADPATFGATVANRIRHFDRAGRDRYLAIAAAAASEAQRRELTTAVENLHG